MNATTRHRTRKDRRGFTLIEMMVTVAILALMVAAFGQIIGEAQTLVVTSQAIMRANARATSLAGVIREDVARASQLGFLHVSNNKVYIATPGPCTSVLDGTTGTGSIVAIGRADTDLYRGRWILADTDTGLPNDAFTVSGASPDFTDLQTATDTEINDTFVARMDTITENLSMKPDDATTLNNINGLWPLLARDCSNLEIRAYASDMTPVSGTWTRDDADWPVMLKITITLSDPEVVELAEDTAVSGEFKYEIICPVRP
jgi:prepilin-type N-terminal cleavage/methylation domain-containing protein